MCFLEYCIIARIFLTVSRKRASHVFAPSPWRFQGGHCFWKTGKSKCIRENREMSGDLGFSVKCQGKWGVSVGKEYFSELFLRKILSTFQICLFLKIVTTDAWKTGAERHKNQNFLLPRARGFRPPPDPRSLLSVKVGGCQGNIRESSGATDLWL